MFGITFNDETPTAMQERPVTTDFDFDCGFSGIFQYCPGWFCYALDVCGVVARTMNSSTRSGEAQLYRWAVVGSSGGSTWTAGTWDSSFTTMNANRINAVTGMTFESNLTFHLEMSEAVSNSTDKTQTRYQRYTGFLGGPTTSFTYQSDMETCATSAADGSTVPAATPYGGHSIAYCPNCGSGSVEAIGWGREWGGGTYCW